MKLEVEREHWPLQKPFRISGLTLSGMDVVVVPIEQDGFVGRGEAAGVFYLQDDVQAIVRAIEAVRPDIEAGITRDSLQKLLPAAGARNAVDCALWDLEAKQSERSVWQLAGLNAPRPLVTAYTLGADSPAEMAEGARCFAGAKLLKLKLTGEPQDADRIAAVRAARPDVSLTVDANQSFTRDLLEQLLPTLTEARVSLIEQPFQRGDEALHDGLRLPIPVAADESVQTEADLPIAVGRFDLVNIKLDKAGGLTGALAMARAARRLGLDIMVGHMGGTALAMAPGFLIGQLCRFVDLDGPALLRSDRSPGALYTDGQIWCSEAVWGSAAAS